MTTQDTEEDLEALFEEVATQFKQQTTPQKTTQLETVSEPTSEPTTDKPIFERLGGVVRILHDSMRELGYDRSLADATSQITDVHGRLTHIAMLTEQAANTVLNATDEAMPAQDALSKKAKEMEERWGKFFEGDMSVEAFKELAHDSRTFAQDTIAATEAEKSRLLNIMMSQDFQDLTGQLIKKVAAITSAVESELAQILIDNAPAGVAPKEKTVELMEGPSSSGLLQDDVDDLLDTLGF